MESSDRIGIELHENTTDLSTWRQLTWPISKVWRSFDLPASQHAHDQINKESRRGDIVNSWVLELF